MPDYVHVGMAIELVSAGLLSLRDLVLFVPSAPRLLFSLIFLLGVVVAIAIPFLRRYHLPLLFESALPDQLVLRVCQVDTNLAAVEYVV